MADNNTRIVITAQAGQAIAQMRSLGDAVGGLKDRILGLPMLGGALAGVLSVGAMSGAIKGIIDTADELNDLSQRVGIGIKDLVSYKLAADQSGTSLESVARGIKGLSAYIVENGKAFAAAGISTKSAAAAMEDVADLFQVMPDGPEKTALAVKLFGKAGMELIPMLNNGSQALRESAEKTARLGATYEALAPQADKFNDQMAELAMYSKAAGLNIANELLPTLNSLVSAMAQAAKDGGVLRALFVGLGGVASQAVTDFDVPQIDKVKRRVQETRDELAAYNPLSITGPSRSDLETRLSLLLKEQSELEKSAAAETAAAEEKKRAARDKSGKEMEAWVKRFRTLMGNDGGKTAPDAFSPLMKSLWGDIAGKEAELAGMANGTALTDAEKRYSKFLAEITSGYLKLTPPQIGRTAVEWEKLINADRAIVEARKAKQAAEDARRAGEIVAGLHQKFGDQTAEKIESLLVMPSADRDLGKTLRQIAEDAQHAKQELAKMQNLDPAVLAEKIGEVDAAMQAQTESARALAKEQERLNGSWEYGADKALRSYLDAVQNVAASSEQMFKKAFDGMEDALVKFVTTGKLDFKSLADSIVADITRMVIRAQITGPLSQLIMGNGGAGQFGNIIGSLGNFFGGTQSAAPVTDAVVTMLPGLATGGPALAGSFHRVNENGPELLNYGGRDYLMMGGQDGYVKPVGTSTGGGRTVSVVNHFTLAAPADTRTQNQIATMAGSAIQRALARNA